MEGFQPIIALEGNPKVKSFTDPFRMNARVFTQIAHLTIVVPDSPRTDFKRFSGEVIIAFFPPPSRNRMIDSIFGFIDPGLKCPSARYLFISGRVAWGIGF
jgi:hypothetical protein